MSTIYVACYCGWWISFVYGWALFQRAGHSFIIAFWPIGAIMDRVSYLMWSFPISQYEETKRCKALGSRLIHPHIIFLWYGLNWCTRDEFSFIVTKTSTFLYEELETTSSVYFVDRFWQFANNNKPIPPSALALSCYLKTLSFSYFSLKKIFLHHLLSNNWQEESVHPKAWHFLSVTLFIIRTPCFWLCEMTDEPSYE